MCIRDRSVIRSLLPREYDRLFFIGDDVPPLFAERISVCKASPIHSDVYKRQLLYRLDGYDKIKAVAFMLNLQKEKSKLRNLRFCIFAALSLY